ncbi:MAG TPA: hypothetical protein VGG03_10695 [Thermoanaerobaculia bacterium]|jgi:hypothetical protein
MSLRRNKESAAKKASTLGAGSVAAGVRENGIRENGAREDKESATKKAWAWGAGSISTGVIFVLLALVMEDAPEGASSSELLYKFMEHMGIALISIGILGIIVDFRSWQKYFQARMAETIIQRDYLKTLSKPQLIDLQTDTLKAFFRVDDIDRKGSLLEFFHDKVHNYIGSPYRENIQAVLSIVPTEDGTGYVVDDVVSYTCKKVGDYIQEEVRWLADADEILALDEFKVQIRVPQNFFQSPEFKTRYPSISMPETFFDMKDNSHQRLIPAEKGHGYTLALSEFKQIDDLYVKVSVRYTIAAGRMITWKMTHPSKNVTGAVRFPSDSSIHVEVFGFNREELNEELRPGLYTFNYGSWLLPYTGFAFDFRRLEEAVQESGKAVLARGDDLIDTAAAEAPLPS